MDVFGLTVESKMYLSDEEDALRVLEDYIESITSVEEERVGEVKKVSKDDLDEFFEEHGPLDVEYNLVESKEEIENVDEYRKIDVLFLHFHDPNGAWRYFNDESYEPTVIGR